MNNPHIVVGENRRCLCGVYEGVSVSCASIIAASARLVTATHSEADARLVTLAIATLVQDCP